MLSAGIHSPAPPLSVGLRRPSVISMFLFPSSLKQCFQPKYVFHPQLHSLSQGRGHLFAQKKQNESKSSVVEAEIDMGLEDEEEDYLGDEDEEEEGDDEEDDVFIPFEQMKTWMRKKPKGFGEGKVYDTSIEDKLLEEIERSKQIQLASINKLKSSSNQNKPNKELMTTDEQPAAITASISVRINNLPKKRNIERDLKSAFKGAPGMIKISPAVSGNKKTREPVCRGFAFVDFKSSEYASRFIQMFSGQSIAFGKVNKQISCEILKRYDNPQEVSGESGDHAFGTPSADPIVRGEHEGIVSEIDEHPTSSNSGDEAAFKKWEDFSNVEVIRGMEYLKTPDLGKEINTKSPMKSLADTSSSKHEKSRAMKKKSGAQRNTNKTPVLNIAGAAKKLKMKEKEMLADAFSKYGTKAPLTSRES